MVKLHSFLTSTLDGVEWSDLCCDSIAQGNRAGYALEGVMSGQDLESKREVLSGL